MVMTSPGATGPPAKLAALTMPEIEIPGACASAGPALERAAVATAKTVENKGDLSIGN
jgi:hypothetical protein